MATHGPDADERPSIPAGPLAIDRLAQAMDRFTAATTDKLDRIASSIEKLESNQRLMLHEFTGLAKRVADHEVRITELEARTRSNGELYARAQIRRTKVKKKSPR